MAQAGLFSVPAAASASRATGRPWSAVYGSSCAPLLGEGKRWWLRSQRIDISPRMHVAKPETFERARVDVVGLASLLIAGVGCARRWGERRGPRRKATIIDKMRCRCESYVYGTVNREMRETRLLSDCKKRAKCEALSPCPASAAGPVPSSNGPEERLLSLRLGAIILLLCVCFMGKGPGSPLGEELADYYIGSLRRIVHTLHKAPRRVQKGA